MNLTVHRRIAFCAGHRLMLHGGKCENMHGHNYLAEFAITATEVDSVGRVVDFADIKRLFKGWIDEHWDHGFIVWDKDVDCLKALRAVVPNKVFELPDNPTAENLAKFLLTRVGPQLLAEIPKYNLKLTQVTVWETKEAFARVALTRVADK